MDREPDILLVVLDCIRYQDFKQLVRDQTGNGVLASLARSSMNYSRAVAPSSWSLPSHASLFTGLEPWEHSCNSRGRLRLATELHTVAEGLSRKGYQTASFSANPWISESTGLTKGFNIAFWGGLGDWLTPKPPNSIHGDTVGSRPQSEVGAVNRRSSDDRFRSVLELISHQYPGILDAIRRVLRHVERSGTRHTTLNSEWIEPMFDEFVARLSPTDPFFAFINLPRRA